MDTAAAEKLVETHPKAWSERDAAGRLALLREAYTADALLNDPEEISRGPDDISDVIAKLHAKTEGFVFRLVGKIDVQHDALRLGWEYGSPQNPGAITGQDFMLLRDGKIAAVCAFIDAPAGQGR